MSSEWPRRYAPAEIEAIAESIGQTKLKPLARRPRRQATGRGAAAKFHHQLGRQSFQQRLQEPKGVQL